MDIAQKGTSYVDLQGLAELKAQAGKNPDDEATLRKVASQFESMFTNMILKAQRDAGFGDPMFDSSAMDFYRDMHDKQLSVHMSENGGVGLADMIVAQLSRDKHYTQTTSDVGLQGYMSSPVARPPAPVQRQEKSWSAPDEFIQQLLPHAQRGGEALGLDPQFILAQAALETGWGEHVPADGRGSSFNVFGIKAQSGWTGERVWKNTLEYNGGQFESSREPFRRYSDLGQSVDDYVEFLQQNPRYENALKAAPLGASAFAQELSEAGYATDPHYAKKIMQVINSDTMQGLTESSR